MEDVKQQLPDYSQIVKMAINDAFLVLETECETECFECRHGKECPAQKMINAAKLIDKDVAETIFEQCVEEKMGINMHGVSFDSKVTQLYVR